MDVLDNHLSQIFIGHIDFDTLVGQSALDIFAVLGNTHRKYRIHPNENESSDSFHHLIHWK